MATTIKSGFQQLSANLEITSLQSSTVSTTQQNVREAVERGLTVLDSFLAGSYARSTMIGPLKDCDIDIFVILDPNYYQQYNPTSLLDKLRTVLLQTYPTTPKISRNGQAVTITFTDFKVDVVPAFNRFGGGYLIPDSYTNSWISTNPTVHASSIIAENKAHNGSIVPLVKMIKGWNRNINGAFSGFYLELTVIKILNNVNIINYSSGARFVFDKGRESIKFKISDPAGFENQVGGFANIDNLANAISRFDSAYNRALKAEEYEANNKIPSAFDEWRKIFGDYFPAYG